MFFVECLTNLRSTRASHRSSGWTENRLMIILMFQKSSVGCPFSFGSGVPVCDVMTSTSTLDHTFSKSSFGEDILVCRKSSRRIVQTRIILVSRGLSSWWCKYIRNVGIANSWIFPLKLFNKCTRNSPFWLSTIVDSRFSNRLAYKLPITRKRTDTTLRNESGE